MFTCSEFQRTGSPPGSPTSSSLPKRLTSFPGFSSPASLPSSTSSTGHTFSPGSRGRGRSRNLKISRRNIEFIEVYLVHQKYWAVDIPEIILIVSLCDFGHSEQISCVEYEERRGRKLFAEKTFVIIRRVLP